MADTAYGVNDAEAVKLWSNKLAREALKRTYIKRFIGPSSDSMIQQKNETNKGPGDRIRITLRMQLTGDGVVGDGNLEGNEESLTTFTDDLIINQLRHAVRSEGKMTEQRIPFSIREEGMQGLADWWADRWDTWAFNHLAGYTPANANNALIGHNTIAAPTRQVWADDTSPETNNSDEDLVLADTFTLFEIDKAVERAKVTTTGANPTPIRPLMVDGEPWFVVFLHPYQVTDLKATATVGQVTWYDIQKAAIQSGVGVAKNPIFSGALGTYNGCILHESTRVPQGVDSVTGLPITTVRRAILAGAQAGVCGFGQGHDKSTYDWFEQMFDYGNKLGVKAGCISGLKKSRYNSQDFGVVVMSTWAAAHGA
jgi:N4-gp56 family major capsid protein